MANFKLERAALELEREREKENWTLQTERERDRIGSSVTRWWIKKVAQRFRKNCLNNIHSRFYIN